MISHSAFYRNTLVPLLIGCTLIILIIFCILCPKQVVPKWGERGRHAPLNFKSLLTECRSSVSACFFVYTNFIVSCSSGLVDGHLSLMSWIIYHWFGMSWTCYLWTVCKACIIMGQCVVTKIYKIVSQYMFYMSNSSSVWAPTLPQAPRELITVHLFVVAHRPWPTFPKICTSLKQKA